MVTGDQQTVIPLLVSLNYRMDQRAAFRFLLLAKSTIAESLTGTTAVPSALDDRPPKVRFHLIWSARPGQWTRRGAA
jgi:hypothetical protein